jgi:DNA-binding XRE family transcriptional regulator
MLTQQHMSCRLKEYRTALTRPLVSQETLARKAGITFVTYIGAEHGKLISYRTATAIAKAINDLRRERKMAEVPLEDLAMNFR